MIWIGLVIGYILGACLMRRHMGRHIKRITAEEFQACTREYEIGLLRRIGAYDTSEELV